MVWVYCSCLRETGTFVAGFLLLTSSFFHCCSIFYFNLKLDWSAFYSKIELWELQRHLWTQFSSRLSDECFDQLTLGRHNCDPADGSLSKRAFLDFATRLLASSGTGNGMAPHKQKQWPFVGKLLQRSSKALVGCYEDLNEEDDVQAEVRKYFLSLLSDSPLIKLSILFLSSPLLLLSFYAVFLQFFPPYTS